MRESRPMAGRAMTMEIGERFGYHPFHSIFHHNFRIPYGLRNSVKNQQSVNIQTDSERSPNCAVFRDDNETTSLYLCNTIPLLDTLHLSRHKYKPHTFHAILKEI
mmetsp:Transcript_31258/g.62262  ORF Transcript_31258/g.62262 Transcript_31258/m.62262 type:complete len:105 (-) Transcript_31258:25-339(-)